MKRHTSLFSALLPFLLILFGSSSPSIHFTAAKLSASEAFSKPAPKKENIKIKGFITYATEDYIVVDEYEIHPSSKLKMERERDREITFADLQPGWDVEINGKVMEDGTVVAREIRVKNRKNERIEIKGYMEEMGDGYFIIEGRRAILMENAKIKIEDPNVASLQDVTPSHQVEIKGVQKDDGSIRVKELKVKERDLEDRGNLLTLSQEEEHKLREKLEIYENPDVQKYIEELGKSLVPDHAAEDLDFTFTVIKDPSLNAFAMPHGAVYVHTGLLARMDNESQIATVLGHEIAHVTHEHGYRQYRNRYKIGLGILAAQIGAAVLATQIDNEYLRGTVYAGLGLTVAAAVNGYGRSMEDEADRVGLRYMVKDDFDPREGPEVWQTFRKTYGDQSSVENFFYGNHSTSRQREKNLNKEIALNYQDVVAQENNFRINEKKYQYTMRYLIRDNGIEDYKIKRYNTAKAQFEKVLNIMPEDPISLLYLGNIERDTAIDPAGLNNAIPYYERAMKADPRYADVYRELGYTYEKKGDRKAAVQNYEEYLELAPDAPDARAVRKRIRELK